MKEVLAKIFDIVFPVNTNRQLVLFLLLCFMLILSYLPDVFTSIHNEFNTHMMNIGELVSVYLLVFAVVSGFGYILLKILFGEVDLNYVPKEQRVTQSQHGSSDLNLAGLSIVIYAFGIIGSMMTGDLSEIKGVLLVVMLLVAFLKISEVTADTHKYVNTPSFLKKTDSIALMFLAMGSFVYYVMYTASGNRFNIFVSAYTSAIFGMVIYRIFEKMWIYFIKKD